MITVDLFAGFDLYINIMYSLVSDPSPRVIVCDIISLCKAAIYLLLLQYIVLYWINISESILLLGLWVVSSLAPLQIMVL